MPADLPDLTSQLTAQDNFGERQDKAEDQTESPAKPRLLA